MCYQLGLLEQTKKTTHHMIGISFIYQTKDISNGKCTAYSQKYTTRD
jgi:hypothetical protein